MNNDDSFVADTIAISDSRPALAIFYEVIPTLIAGQLHYTLFLAARLIYIPVVATRHIGLRLYFSFKLYLIVYA